MKKLILFLLAATFAIAQINSARMLSGVNYQAGPTYLIVPADATRLTQFTGSGLTAVTLLAGTTPFFGAGSLFSISNIGTGTVTVTCIGCTVNQQGTLVLTQGQGADIYGDGLNYAANLGSGSGGGGGGGGSGNVSNSGTPLITQMAQFVDTTHIQGINTGIYVTSNFAWIQSPVADLSSPGAKTVSLSPCPLGVSGTNPDHRLYIAGTGTPEVVKITGGTCVSGAATGSVQFTTVNAHAAGYNLGSATAGWKEASEYAKFIPSNPTGSAQGGVVMGLPGVAYSFQGRLQIDAAWQTLDFNGSIFECNMTADDCIVTGEDASVSSYTDISIHNARGRAMVASSGAMIRIHSQNTRIIHAATRQALSGGSFASLIVADNDDRSFLIDGLNTELGTWAGTCSSTSCATAIVIKPFATGTINSSNLSLGCTANGVDNQGSNSLSITGRTVIEGYPQFGIKSAGGFDTTLNVAADVYEEVGNCTNPKGTGIVGLLLKEGKSVYEGVGPSGKAPTFTASSPGATVNSYWVIGTHSTLGNSNSFFAGTCSHSGAGTCTVLFPQFGDSGTTFAIIRQQGAANSMPQPYTANCTGGSVSQCGSVTTGLTTAACSNSVCPFVDTVSNNTAAYTVPVVAYYPALDHWGAAVVLTKGSDGSNYHNSNTRLFLRSALGLGSVASVTQAPAIFAQQCSDGVYSGSPTWLVCSSPDPTLSLPFAYILPSTTTGNAANGTKGGLNFLTPLASQNSGARDVVTFGDSAPDKTLASLGFRPAYDAADTAFCLDQSSTVGPASNQACIRAPISLSIYIGNLPDNTNWVARWTSTLATFKVPIIMTTAAGGGVQCAQYDNSGQLGPTGLGPCGSGGGGGTLTSINGLGAAAQFLTTNVIGAIPLSFSWNDNTATHRLDIQQNGTNTWGAGFLNGNVVQGINNDANICGTILNQILTLGWLGSTGCGSGTPTTLAVARGGLNLGAIAANQFALGTAANVYTATTITDCNGGSNALNFTQSTHLFSCLSIASLTNPMTTLGDMISGGASGTPARLAGPASPDGAVYTLTSIPASGAAVAPTWSLGGISGRTVSGTSDTILYTDRTTWVKYTSGSAVAVTLPQAGSTNFGSNFVFRILKTGASDVTVTPTTSTINGASTLVIHQGENCIITSLDNTNYTSECSPGQLVAGTGIGFTRSDTGSTISANSVGTPSRVTNQSTSQSSVAIGTALSAGGYSIHYYANVNTSCSTGGNSVSFTFTWVDTGATRTLTTGGLSLAAGAPSASGYLTGIFPIEVGSGNVTYTSTIFGACASGTSSYDARAFVAP